MTKKIKVLLIIIVLVLGTFLRIALQHTNFPLPILTFIIVSITLGLLGVPTSTSKSDSINTKSNSQERVPSNTVLNNLNKDYVLSLLREKCHPRLFMQPYDSEKVAIANELYSLLTDDCSLLDLSTILSKATDKLKIDLDTTLVVSELLKACSPENFMEPYDSERIARANELYSKILENKSNILELIQLKEEAINNGLFVLSQNANELYTESTGFEDQPNEASIQEPTKIVNHWLSSTGEQFRLCQYEGMNKNSYLLEERSGESWSRYDVLKLTSGLIENGGVGAEFKSLESPSKLYSIRRLGGTLVLKDAGVISEKWKCI